MNKTTAAEDMLYEQAATNGATYDAHPEAGTNDQSAVSGDLIVKDIESFFLRYVVLPPKASLPLALWAIATFLYEIFDAFPYLAVSSPVPECGKTRLLEISELVVSLPRRASNISEAGLYRVVEKFSPTLMIDEAETLNEKSERAGALRQLINAGNRRGAVATRCVGQGSNLDVKDFNVFCPKVVCGIGTFPATITSRSICISMQRRRKTDVIERFLLRTVTPEGELLRSRANEFASSQREDIEAAYASTRLDFLGDRDADSWAPLFAVLAVASPSRLLELRECAEFLSKAKQVGAADDSLTLRLLHDMRDIWPESEPNAFSETLKERLRGIEDGPWGDKEVDLTERKLARMLKGFKLYPGTVRIGGITRKGYSREAFVTASYPYVGSDPSQASQPA